MVLIIYQAVREIHQRYTNLFDQRLAKVSPKFFDRIFNVYRHPPNCGIRPHISEREQEISIDGLVMLDLVKQCVPRTLHETSCASNGASLLPNLRALMQDSADWRDQAFLLHETNPDQA